MKRSLLIWLIACCPVFTWATEQQMKETLVQIIEQIESIKPLINQADLEQDKGSRIQVHFDDFKDSEGNRHQGLKSDINAIQHALIDIVNQQGLEERKVGPIQGDFIK